jgi:hypothetical protein
VAEATIPVPLWLLWARALCGALSTAAFVIHYNLRVRDRRKVKRAIVTFYVAVARANRLARLSAAAAAVEAGMRAIYGRRIRRLAAISFSISILYFIGAFLISGGLSFDWKSARALKTRLEMLADPTLHSMPPAELSRATEHECSEFGCSYNNDDPAAVATRERISRFEEAYRGLVAKQPARTELTMLTLWEGTYVSRGDPVPAVSLFCFNVLLDLSGVLLVMRVAGQLSKRLPLLHMIPIALLAVAGSLFLASLSVYSYGLVDRGDVWGAAAVLGVPLGAMILLLFISLSVWMVVEKVRGDEDASWVAALVCLGGSFLVGLPLLTDAWSHLSPPRPPPIQLGERATWFFYLIAAGTVLPTLIGTAFVVGVVLFGASARALLFPTLIYVRTVLRVPAPLLVTLTAAPAVVFQTLVSTWPEIHKMLRLT